MIDDLTLKARIMALDPDNIQKNPLMGMRTGNTWSQRNLPTWTPGIGANAQVGKDYAKTQNRDFATLNEQQKKENKALNQQQNRTQHQQNAALRGNPVLPENYQRTGPDGQQQKPETMLAAADLNAQKLVGNQNTGLNGSDTVPDTITNVQNLDADGKVISNQVKETNKEQVPENTEQGGGGEPNQDQSQTSTPAPAPAIPGGSPPAPPANIPLPAGSPATPPPPPNMAAPLPPLNAGHMNTGGQQNNPVFNIGTQGQQQQGQAAPQNDPKTNAKNMQVANATERANTKGGIGTGVMSNLLTGGLAGVARLGYNAYQRGQGKKELAELAKSPYSKVLSVFEIRKGISARNTTEVLRRGRI